MAARRRRTTDPLGTHRSHASLPVGAVVRVWRRLEVRLHGTAAHTDAGEPTITEREAYPDLENLREVEITCDFEGEVVVVLGGESPNRFRAQALEEPARLAVDFRR